MMHPASLREKYAYGFWIAFYIQHDLVQLFRWRGEKDQADKVLKAYYSSGWDKLLE